jgi:hypothetical protein
VNNSTRHPVNEIASREDGIIPKTKRNTSLSKKSKGSFDKMTVFSFDGTILLVGVGTGETMSDASILKIAMQFLIFPSPIGLNRKNFNTQRSLNSFLKLIEDMLNI